MEHTAHGYWLTEAGERPVLAAADGDLRCDVLVVGGGYTGMWAAWELSQLEPDARVIVIEAERCGHGPSGRNGGFANAMWFSAHALRDRFGGAAAGRALRAAPEAGDRVGPFCSENEGGARVEQRGYLPGSAAPAPG